MKAVVVLCFVLVAMAGAQNYGSKVKVAELPGQVNVVDNNPGPIQEDSAYYRPGNNANSGPYTGPDGTLYNVDQAFYRPSAGNPPNGGYQQPSFGPTLVQNRPPYPKYQHPGARDGK